MTNPNPLRKIISGGQTGADQGALFGARRAGIETGGWAPKDFMTEIGPQGALLKDFGLVDSGRGYLGRTRLNVQHSTATAICGNPKSRGTAATIKIAQSLKRPLIINPTPEELADFIIDNQVDTLNVAGPRASKDPSIFYETEDLILKTAELLLLHAFSQ